MGIACFVSQTQVGHMNLRNRVNETVRSSMELRRETNDLFMTSLRTELAIVRTLCLLARQEKGKKRFHHVEQARAAFDMALELAWRLSPGRQERDEIEAVRRDVLSFCITPYRA